MRDDIGSLNIVSWIFGVAVFVIGVLNLFLVHPVPAFIYFFLALVYVPPASVILEKWLGFSISLALKIVLGILIMMFTLGVSDLGDMID